MNRESRKARNLLIAEYARTHPDASHVAVGKEFGLSAEGARAIMQAHGVGGWTKEKRAAAAQRVSEMQKLRKELGLQPQSAEGRQRIGKAVSLWWTKNRALVKYGWLSYQELLARVRNDDNEAMEEIVVRQKLRRGLGPRIERKFYGRARALPKKKNKVTSSQY